MGLLENIAKMATEAAVAKAVTGNSGSGLGGIVNDIASNVSKSATGNIAGQIAGQVVSKKLGGGVLGKVAGELVQQQVAGQRSPQPHAGSTDVANSVINVIKMGSKALGK